MPVLWLAAPNEADERTRPAYESVSSDETRIGNLWIGRAHRPAFYTGRPGARVKINSQMKREFRVFVDNEPPTASTLAHDPAATRSRGRGHADYRIKCSL